MNVIVQIEARGTLEVARRIAQVIGQITGWAATCGIVKYDLAGGLGKAVKVGKSRHFAALTDPTEFGQLLCDIEYYRGEPAICYALRILPYVFVRSGELRGAAWSEFDFEAAEWIIPAERMKKRRPHIVPLAPQVVNLFQSMREYAVNSALVFPSAQSATRCVSDIGLLNALRRMGYGKDKMTIHGFRTCASTILNEQGFNRDWIELQLAHTEANKVRSVYNRAQWLPERRKMMCEWADYIDSLREDAAKCHK